MSQNNRPLVPPEEQVFSGYKNPALSLFERFLRDAEAAYKRGGWPALTLYLRNRFQAFSHDGLTGLFTRDAFFMVLEEVILPRMQRVKLRPGETYGSLVVIDIDRFKNVNGAYGHAGGDVILHTLGKLIKKPFRPHDVIGRVGGDEFLILAEGLSPEDAEERIGQLKNDFERYPFQLERIDDSLSDVPISFSHQVIEISDPSEIYDRIAAADRAVFRAKRKRVAGDN